MSEVADLYIGTEIVLHREDQIAKDHSHDTNGNVMGRAYANPTLAIRLYCFEFTGGDISLE